MIYYILLSIFIIIIFLVKFITNKHPFWNFQPVSRKSMFFTYKDGVIIKSKDVNIDYSLPSAYKWSNISDINLLKKFLNKNYSKNGIYTTNYLKWILNTPFNHIVKLDIKDRNKLNVSLHHNDKLIGTIVGRPIILRIKNNIVEGFYVDLLCIDKKYRNKNLAPKLISKILSIWKKYKLDINLFKVDNTLLPFDSISSYNSYYYLINKCNISGVEGIELKEFNKIDMLEDVYEYFYNNLQKYKLYQIMTIEEFKYYFLSNEFIKTYIIKNNNVICGFISLVLSNYKSPLNKNKKCIELSYFIVDNNYYIYNIINLFKNYDYLIFSNIMDNHSIIDILKPVKSHNTNLHLYNYLTDISANEVGLNII